MRNPLRPYDVAFIGLPLGEHQFVFQPDSAFFDHYGYDEAVFLQPQVHMSMKRSNTLLELEFSFSGKAQVRCDLTDMPFEMEVTGQFPLVVKFGEAFDDTDDEVLILPQGEHQFNVAQYLFELMVLSLPAKRIHPDVQAGKAGTEVLQQLEDLAPKQETPTGTDPRWDKLSDLLNQID